MGDYSYFRAEGVSLQAVETVRHADARIDMLSGKMKDRYGGRFIYWGDDRGFFSFFKKDETLPESFKNETVPETFEVYRETSVELFARPKPGSPDAALVAAMLTLIEKAQARLTLEKVFGCGEMPMRELEIADFINAFVLESPANLETAGKIRPVQGFSYVGGILSWQDRLWSEQMMGHWYIRVPNDINGAPLFTPPDAVPVSYKDMLELDRREYIKRQMGPLDPPLRGTKFPRGPK